ncbi:MAG: polysaccharide deacetylase family protein [Anaerolineae bacterium]
MRKTAYLTIDDAPSPDFLNKLNFLEGHGLRAVWFCTGNFLEQRPEMALEAIQRGHILGNHSYSHPAFSELSLDQCYAEIRATDAVIEELYQRSGESRQRRYFRFPYGDKGSKTEEFAGTPDAAGQERRAAIQAYLRKLGYAQPTFPDISYRFYRESALAQDADWLWTYDTHDWAVTAENPPYGINSIEKLLARMDEDVPEGWRGLNYAGSADLVLTHDFAGNNAVFVAEIERLLAKGLEFRLP